MHPSGNQPLSPLVPWILWFSIFSGLLVMQFIIGGGIPQGADRGSPPLIQQVAPMVPAFLALIVRFLIIPRVPDPVRKLPVMIMGLAFAEATGILGLFLVSPDFPATKLTHFCLSALTILLCAPVYMKPRPEPDHYLR